MSSDIKTECLINGVQYNCRTCFDPGRTTFPLTDEACDMKTWRDLLKDIAQLETHDEELLPKTLCCKCLDKLKKSYDFVLQIHSVNDKYSQLLTKDGLLNEVDNFTDCLAESAIALPLEQCMPEIKMEEELVVPYDNNLSNNKLQKENEAAFENEDIDDPFTETFDDDLKSTSDKLEDNESAIARLGKSSTKRIRCTQIVNRDSDVKHVKRTRKPKQKPNNMEKSSQSDEINNPDDNNVKVPIVCGKCTHTFFTIHTYQRHQQAEHSSESNEERNKCPICSKEFRNKFYVVDHIKVVHDKLRPFKCSHCTKTFASAASKRIHELSHTDNFPYPCEHCDRRFRLPSKLKIHSEIHTTKPELLCPICKRSQKSQQDLEVHIKNHDDNRLQCPSCGHLFRKRSNLNDHYNAVHLKLRPYKCEFCEMGFGDRKSRRVHQRSHLKKDTATYGTITITGKSTTKRNRGKKFKQLDESDELFRKPVKRPKKVKQPKKTVTPTQSDEINSIIEDDDGKETIVCDKCSQTFPTIHTYQRHQQAEHSGESHEEKNKCPICSKEFRNSWYVVDHIKVVHDKLKPFKCSHCPKSFASAHSKRIHELTHTDNFPYACEYCDRRFRLSSKLKIHSEIHTTKPELLCPICKRSQKSQAELEVHVKNHDDNRLQCPSCGNMFRRNAQLKDHYNAVHLKLRPYKCEFCELGFGDRKTRRVHQRTHHKPELSKTNRTLTGSDDNDSNDDDNNDDDYNPSRSLTESGDNDSNHDDDSGPTSATLSSVSEYSGIYRKRLRRKKGPATVTAITKASAAKQSRPSRLRKRNSLQGERNLDQQNKLSGDEINQNVQNWLFGYRLYSKPTAWRLVQCKLCSTNFKTCKELRQHLKGHSDVDTLNSLNLTDNIVQYLFPNMINLDLIKKSICKDIKKKQWFKYYSVLNEYSFEMSISDTEVDELEEEILERVRKYKCALCAQEFSYKYQIYPHLKQYHSKEKAPFKCDRCALEFASDKMYKQHLQTHCHNNHKSLLCGLCPCKFVWPENIKNHKCATQLLDPSSAAAPKNQEPLNEPTLKATLRCCLCEHSFQKLKHLRQHMPLHADGNTSIDFKNCTYIKQFESSKKKIFKMLKLKIKNDYKKCQISRFYQAMDKYGNEMDISDSESESDSEGRTEEVDGGNTKDAYKCKLCKETFQKRKYVLMHQEERHIDMEMPFNCEVCNQKYVSVDLLLQHLKRECRNEYRKLGEQCEFCNVRFIWPNHLLKHKEMQHHLKAESFNSTSSCGSSTLSETITTKQPFSISSCGSSASSETISSATDKETNNRFKTEQLATTDVFKESKDLDTTSTISNESVKYICYFCGVSSSSISTLKVHIKKQHKDEKPFKCGHCQMAFTQASDLKSHARSTHADKQSFKCFFCYKTFSQKSDLINHRRMHKGEKETKCSICQKSFTTPANMRQHMLSHFGERPFECDICGQKFLRNSNLKVHRRIMGHAPADGIICKKSSNMRQYTSRPSRSGERPCECDICGQKFLCNSDLKRHCRMKGHAPADCILLKNSITNVTKDKPCSICGVYLARNTNIRLHMRTHTGEKPHKCDLCDMAFIRRCDFLYHRRIHTNDRPYKCPHCEKRFPITQRLKKHILTHTGERPFQCTVCKKSYNTAEYLKIHMVSHTGEKPFKCELCDKAFTCAGYLSKHRKKSHPSEIDNQVISSA